MRKCQEIVVLICLFFIFILPMSGTAEDLTKWPLGFPEGQIDGEEVVTLDEVRKIAGYEARRTWGKVARITEIPCLIKNGSIVAYQVVFRLGATQSGQASENQNVAADEDSYHHICQRIKAGRKLFEEASKRLKKAIPEMNRRLKSAQENDSTKSSRYLNRMDAIKIQRKPVSIAPTQEYKEAYEAKEEARRMMTGVGQYGTVLVTVREGLVPVPVVSHGLPLFYTRADVMQQITKKRLGGEPKITRIYMAGPLDQWYEFTTLDGERVLIDPFRGHIFSSGEATDVIPDEMFMTMPAEKSREKRRTLLEAAEREILK